VVQGRMIVLCYIGLVPMLLEVGASIHLVLEH
jgi:hypothetical protein